MKYILEAFSRQDGLILIRFHPRGDRSIAPVGEVCLWYGEEGVAAIRPDDRRYVMEQLSGCIWEEAYGYSRLLFDGIGLHKMAPVVEDILSGYPVAAVSVSDIRLAVLLPTEQADAAALALWAHYGKEIQN